VGMLGCPAHKTFQCLGSLMGRLREMVEVAPWYGASIIASHPVAATATKLPSYRVRILERLLEGEEGTAYYEILPTTYERGSELEVSTERLTAVALPKYRYLVRLLSGCGVRCPATTENIQLAMRMINRCLAVYHESIHSGVYPEDTELVKLLSLEEPSVTATVKKSVGVSNALGKFILVKARTSANDKKKTKKAKKPAIGSLEESSPPPNSAEHLPQLKDAAKVVSFRDI